MPIFSLFSPKSQGLCAMLRRQPARQTGQELCVYIYVSFVPIVRPTTAWSNECAWRCRPRKHVSNGFLSWQGGRMSWPADIQPLLDLFGGSKQLLKKFQGLLDLQVAGPSASCQTPVGRLPKTCGGMVILQSFLACRLNQCCSLHSQCTVAAIMDASLHSAMTNYGK